MSGTTGEINGWVCEGTNVANVKRNRPGCGRITYVIHVDDGVTPFYLACRADGHEPDSPESTCKGMGRSLMYPAPPVPAHIIEAVAWEWYMPVGGELRRLAKKARQRGGQDAAVLEHIDNGGLLLRPLTDAGRAVLADA